MKEEILKLLREETDYVSGQELCRRFQVSRTAVWKVVGQLRSEGYEIEAVRNRGYRLVNAEDVYSEKELAGQLHTVWAGRPLHFFETIGSTNVRAKTEAEEGAGHGTLIVADMQTAGRGRRGRDWSSPGGLNLYYSLLLRPEFSPDKASMLTLVMACAVVRGMKKLPELSGADIGIKWPNDIVMNGRKICGILTEMSAERDYIQYVVIGCGINVGKQEFGEELAKKATSLEAELGQKISRSRLLSEILEAFEEIYGEFAAALSLEKLKDSYNEMLVNRNRQVCVLDPAGEYRGTAKGINDAGELLVELPDGRVREVFAGEVSVRGIYGYV